MGWTYLQLTWRDLIGFSVLAKYLFHQHSVPRLFAATAINHLDTNTSQKELKMAHWDKRPSNPVKISNAKSWAAWKAEAEVWQATASNWHERYLNAQQSVVRTSVAVGAVLFFIGFLVGVWVAGI